jgi:hypothetical protein
MMETHQISFNHRLKQELKVEVEMGKHLKALKKERAIIFKTQF